MNKPSFKKLAVVSAAALMMIMTGCGSEAGSAKQTKTFDGKQVQELVIQTEGQHIEVRPSGNQEIKISMDANQEIPAALSGDVLSIKLGSSSSVINFKTAKLQVDLPSKTYRKLSLMTASGQITGEGLQAQELQLSSDSGNIEINGYEGNQIKGEIVAGNLDLKSVNGGLILNNDTGHIQISHKGKMGMESRIKTGSGSVDLVFENRPAALQLDVSTESGSIQSSLTSPGDMTSKGAGSQLTAVWGAKEGGAPLLSIRSSSGSIHLK
ncbi:DUF4097 family beta strand repeat-containing protein [Paenibacillus filicis]|uniref:DUF4097 family beta strand repeat-containing protein n=1 Tax=Paenibacillus filicis TaxID=669464 RepID=A0ABU9DHI6_9BACL